MIFGAFRRHLVRAIGLYRDRNIKASHKAHIWGMYVALDERGGGMGRELLKAALDHASSIPAVTWVHVGVTSAAPAAERFYTRAGFRIWGTEPDALRHAGESAIERHMAVRLHSRRR